VTQTDSVDVQAFLNEHPYSGVQWTVFALCFVIVLLDGVDIGGVGAVLFGGLMDRCNANKIIALGYLPTALSMHAIGRAAGNVGLLMLFVFVAGTIMNTAQSSMPALAAACYPTQGRATGVAWVLGIGRFGGIAGSLPVAELTRRQLGFEAIFSVLAVPGRIAAAAMWVKQLARPQAAGAGVGGARQAHGH
jgi:AAHS family 4-hydroxybenzoate transporter-like MFS transporter